MVVRVLVVDDSSFFRRQIQKLLSSDSEIEVVATANDGKDAIEKTLEFKPDVITMDIEMPVMDGITATRQIMSQRPTPILMFSSLTTDGAKATLEALDAGALDFIPKRFEDISRNVEDVQKVLCEKVKAIGKHRQFRRPHTPPAASPVAASPVSSVATSSQRRGRINLLAIGTSTGGPVALQEVLTKLPASFSVPIVLVQHMPATFTPTFAARLNQLCEITVKEAADGDVLKPGTAYLAPGGKQMLIRKRGSESRITIEEGDQTLNYKPCVDITFSSIAEVYSNDVLAIILTGMGADGCEGAKRLKAKGSTIWAQDKQSCVVYGMPSAIADAGIAEKILPLSSFSSQILQQF